MLTTVRGRSAASITFVLENLLERLAGLSSGLAPCCSLLERLRPRLGDLAAGDLLLLALGDFEAGDLTGDEGLASGARVSFEASTAPAVFFTFLGDVSFAMAVSMTFVLENLFLAEGDPS